MSINFISNLENAMEYFHKKGAFLTVKDRDKTNTMTISWGNIGFHWGRPTFMVMVRHSRFTHKLIEGSNEFTVSIPLDDSLKSALAICGSESGRDIDKFHEANLKLINGTKINTPIIDCYGIHYECKVVYKQEMNGEFIEETIKDKMYSDDDFHTLYYGEIVHCFEEK